MADVFAEFCAAGLWPGLGVDPRRSTRPMPASGVRRTSPHPRWPRYRGSPAAVPPGSSPVSSAPASSTTWWNCWCHRSFRRGGQLRLVDALGDDAAAQLRRDPWRLLVLPDATVAQADRLARALESDVSRDDPRRGRALVEWTLARFARDGDTAAPLRAVADGVRGFGVDAGRGGRRRRLPRARWCALTTRPAPASRGSPVRSSRRRSPTSPPDWRDWCGARRRSPMPTRSAR